VTFHVLSAGAVKGLVEALRPRFSAAHHVEFACAFGAVGAMREKLLSREPCDAIILTAAMIDALAADGRVIAGSRVDLGQVLTGIAVPASETTPPVSDEAALATALSNATGIYLPDPERATAGIHFTTVLRKLGIHDAVRERLRPYPNGAMAMRAMADASEAGERNLIGCTQVTEILYTDGVTLSGVLPKAFELATMYAVGVCRESKSQDVARAFAELLGSAETIELRRTGGFDV
jgi:molybdate transport system substrate-binding protein